jgi:hypothetical protein
MRVFVNGLLLNVAVAILAMSTASVSQDRSEMLEHARQFIRTAYPDLAGSGANVVIPLSLDQSWSGTAIRELRILVYRRDHPGSLPSDLVIRYTPDSDGFPQTLTASGPYVNAERHFQLMNEINASKEFPNTAIVARLENLGAQFGPADGPKVAARLNLERFRPLLGELRILDARFLYRTDDGSESAEISWRVNTEWRQGTATRRYRFGFEPFEGRLFAITRTPDD